VLPRTPNSPTNLLAVRIPDTFTLSSSVCPSTSRIPAISTLPFTTNSVVAPPTITEPSVDIPEYSKLVPER